MGNKNLSKKQTLTNQIGVFYLLCYTHSEHICKMSQHKSNRMQGYLLFYLDTKNIRRAPFYAVSIGNFVLLLVDVILNDYCYAYRDSCGPGSRFNKVDWLRGLITVEAMAIM